MKKRMKVFLIAGARPNFMKIAPLYQVSHQFDTVDCRIVHTGQHYDYEMSQAFFEDLELPEPHFYLDAGSGSHAVQTARIMTAFEKVCVEESPDLIVVVGDVNSTLACSIVAKKLLIEVAHVEAGLRSFDMTMPEEVNRMVTDSISDYLFVTEESGVRNLEREGKSPNNIHLVGHVMIDNLINNVKKLQSLNEGQFPTADLKKKSQNYIFLTLHRPSNVDSKEIFNGIAETLNEISKEVPIFFPVHPRTRKMIDEHHIHFSPRIYQLNPLSFKESLFLWKDAMLVMTDSGGLQEETTALKVPCLTLRENTERPITVEIGSNVIAGSRKEGILSSYQKIMSHDNKDFDVPPLWDGKASERIWKIITG